MKKGLHIWMFFGAIVVAAFLLSWGTEFYTQRIAKLPVYGPTQIVNGVEQAHVIPEYSLIAQDGGRFSSAATKGKVSVVNFFFTSCPSICPKMMRNLQSVHELYRHDAGVLFISMTVDPGRDDPARLAKYAESLNANTQQWRFLTGDKKDIYRLARHGYFLSASEGDGGAQDFIHSENIVLVDRSGHIRGYYNGLDEKSMDLLSEHIAKLKTDKS